MWSSWFDWCLPLSPACFLVYLSRARWWVLQKPCTFFHICMHHSSPGFQVPRIILTIVCVIFPANRGNFSKMSELILYHRSPKSPDNSLLKNRTSRFILTKTFFQNAWTCKARALVSSRAGSVTDVVVVVLLLSLSLVPRNLAGTRVSPMRYRLICKTFMKLVCQ